MSNQTHLNLKKIIHIDMDCFFAAIEMRDNPKLKYQPIAVGGSPSGRGIICTSNYEARKYGVKSAMSSAVALKKCPSLVLVKPNMSKYKEASEIVFNIFSKYTDKIQSVSLDEAYLDVTENTSFNNSATLLAKEIRKKIHEQTKVTASAGIAPNKFLAKIASDWNKPNNQYTIQPQMIDEFSKKLDVKFIPGVGKVTKAKLNSLGIMNCNHIREKGLTYMDMHFGKFGKRLHELSYGIDNSEVTSDRERKSLSVENTFSSDINLDQAKEDIAHLFFEMMRRLDNHYEKKGFREIKNIFVKIKTNDFNTHTIESPCTNEQLEVFEDYFRSKGIPQELRNLLEENYLRENKPIRLLGIGVRFKSIEKDNNQLTLL